MKGNGDDTAVYFEGKLERTQPSLLKMLGAIVAFLFMWFAIVFSVTAMIALTWMLASWTWGLLL